MLTTFYNTMHEKCPGASMMRDLAIGNYVPTAAELTGLWSDNDAHVWPMPNGAIVHNNVISQDSFQVDNVHGTYVYHFNKVRGTARGVSLAADIAHSIDAYVASEMQIRCAYHRTGYLPQLCAVYNLLERKGYLVKDRTPSTVTTVSLGNFLQVHHQLSLPFKLRDHAYLEGMAYMLHNLLQTPSFDEVSVFDEFTCLPNYVGHMKQHYINIMAEIADGNLASEICSSIVGEQVEIPKLSTDLSTEILRGDYAIS